MPSLNLDGRQLLKFILGIGGGVTLLHFISTRFFRRAIQDGFKQPSHPDGWKERGQGADGGQKKKGGRRGAASGPSSELRPEEGVWIYYGSQSGTSEDWSHDLKEEAKEYGLRAKVMDLDDFEPEVFTKHTCILMVVATYGLGAPTDNAMRFFKWLKDDSHPTDMLAGVKYTVMGLGNRQYPYFNRAPKQAYAHMGRLGATSIYPRGEGDDDQNIEEDFEQWKENGLWPALVAAVGATGGAGMNEEGKTTLTPEEVLSDIHLKAVLSGAGEAEPAADPLVEARAMDVLGKWYFRAWQAPVIVVKELRQKPDVNGGLTTKHIELDVSGFHSEFHWRTADNLEVLPENPASEVQWFAERLGLAAADMEKSISFVTVPGIEKAQRKPFPTPCTVRTALTFYCDLVALPDRRTMQRLAALIMDNEQQRAAAAALVDDKETYRWLRSSPDSERITFRELFALFFSSAKVDLSTFLQLCPRQKSRPYTISSSAQENAKKIGICVSMVSAKLKSLNFVVGELAKRGHEVPKLQSRLDGLALKDGMKVDGNRERSFKGVCSTMLCTRTKVGDKLRIAVKASTFRLPLETTTPVVMIGAGTGLAPFRAFIREFKAEGGAWKKTMLFFGCRYSTQDFIYKDELEAAISSSPPALSELITAFSREQDHKVYVQHRIKERAEMISKLVSDGAYFYVCGSAAMGDAVKHEVSEALKSVEALKRLEFQGRFITEVW